MGPAEIRSAVLAALHEVAPEVAHVELDGAAPLREEVDLDSIDFLRFLTGVHARLGVEIPESRFEELVSLDDVVRLVEQAARGAGSTEYPE